MLRVGAKDKLTLIWDTPDDGETIEIDFINERELVAWPNGNIHDIMYLINREYAKERSWTFKHS